MMDDFKNKLKQARLDSGKSQSEVAQELGITVSGYASWEQGRTRPNIEMLRKLCRVLKVSADDLLEI